MVGTHKGLKIDPNNSGVSQSIFYKHKVQKERKRQMLGGSMRQSTNQFQVSYRASQELKNTQHIEVMSQLGNIFKLKDKLAS